MTATPEAVTTLRNAVGRFSLDTGVSDPPLADVKLAVSEAVGNVVVHGYRAAKEPGTVWVCAQRGNGELRIIVEDHGQGFAPRTDSPGLGLGVGLMSAVADRLEFRRASPCGTEVHICFALAS